MTHTVPNRAAEFAALAQRAIDPGYRKLWASQVEAYSQAEAKAKAEARAEVGNSEASPSKAPATEALSVEAPVAQPSTPKPTPKWRASNEPAWARLFDVLGVTWKYEALEPHLSKALLYMPDFWLCDRAAWVEVKSAAPTPGEIRAARELLAADGHRVYVVSGWPRRKGYGVWVFAREGEAMAVRSDFSDLALCNLLDVSFGELWRAMEEVRRG